MTRCAWFLPEPKPGTVKRVAKHEREVMVEGITCCGGKPVDKDYPKRMVTLGYIKNAKKTWVDL